MANTSIFAAFERFWQHVVVAIGDKADALHTHDDRYYTETEIDNIVSGLGGSGSIEVDQELNDYSTNPVQNKIVNAAISNLNSLVGDTPVSEQVNNLINEIDNLVYVNVESQESATVPLNADTLGGRNAEEYALASNVTTAIKRAAPYNLLDNSDFRNPVNQRGQTSYGGMGDYCIDRWILQSSTCLYINSGYVTLTDYYDIKQKNGFPIKRGTKYTLAVRIRAVNAPQNLQLGCLEGLNNITLQNTEWQTVLIPGISSNDYGVGEATAAFIGLAASNGSVQLEWAALYEGEYTAETLPEYQPKGYAHELMECMRYFWRYPNQTNSAYTIFGMGTTSSTTTSSLFMMFPIPMRATPSVSAGGNFRLVDSAWTNVVNATEVTYDSASLNIGNSSASLKVTSASNLAAGFYYVQAANDKTAHIDFSADL